jgi:hypothetical protein
MDFNKLLEDADINDLHPKFRWVTEEKTSIQDEINSIFKGDRRYETLKSKATKSDDAIVDFLDYVYRVIGGSQMEKLSKKYKVDFDELSSELLKG